MNDRYLYRAKRIDNGEWVEGLLTIMWGQLHIITPEYENTLYPIDESSICQCTGLNDEDGKKIFEGDIVGYIDCTSTENGYSEHYYRGRVAWDEETASFKVTERLSAESYEVLDRIRQRM